MPCPTPALSDHLEAGWCLRTWTTGRTPAAPPTSSKAFFEELPDAGFCLDVAHAQSIGPTLAVAPELLDRFRARLRHVHLSSLIDGHHVPVAPRDESLFAEVLDRCRDVPWILEGPPPAAWTPQLRAMALVPAGSATPDLRT
jgi:hypothetical protein